MFSFDLISDTHWDYWVNPNSPEHTQKRLFKKIFDLIIPGTHAKHLIIAGDIGHYNYQNKIAFLTLKEYYENIIWVNGNHDLYLFTKGNKYKYKFDSFNRTKELADFAKTVPGLHYLDGDTVTIDGITIGGCCGWYDSTYAIKELNYDPYALNNLWKDNLNDNKYILSPKFSQFGGIFDWETYSKSQKDKLLNICDNCSIIITHIPPTYSKLKSINPTDPVNTFYQFDGSDILDKCSGKIWVYGHIHSNYDFVEKNCRLITNALGYPVYASYSINELNGFIVKTIDL